MIRELSNVPSDSSLLRQYVAEAYFLRAYYYYDLVTFFGGVPLVTEILEVSEPYPLRSTEEDTWARIEKDLQYAVKFLPLKSQQGSSELERASKGAAQALLGKAYLFQEKYDEAAAALEEVIGSDEYRLDSVYAHIFTPDGEFGVESVFEISHSSSSAADWEANHSRSYEGNVDCQLMGVRELSGSDIYNAGWGFNKAESPSVDAFLSEGDTVRMYASIYNVDSLNAREGGDLPGTRIINIPAGTVINMHLKNPLQVMVSELQNLTIM